MSKLHWSERRKLEDLVMAFKDRDPAEARKVIAETNSADVMIAAIIELIEHQAAHFAEAALKDRSKHPQQLAGCAGGLRALLEPRPALPSRAQSESRMTFDMPGFTVLSTALMDIISGQRFGAFAAVKVDPTGHRVTCVCVCGTVRMVAREALEAGEIRGCGCRMTRPGRIDPACQSTFSRDLAALEALASRTKHRGAAV